MNDMFEIENELYKQGLNYIAGVDEAGRGPLAGPVFAAAVVLRNGQFIDEVTDSKKISEKKRKLSNNLQPRCMSLLPILYD